MPFVNTLPSGAVSATFEVQQFPGQHFLQLNDPLITAFTASLPTPGGGASVLARLTALEAKVGIVSVGS
jgi:hypothetical protein